MNKAVYKSNLSSLAESELFLEASREELRVLLAAISGVSEEKIAESAGVSSARAASALALWHEAGILSREELITDEFAERLIPSEIDEESAVKVARDIRNLGLAALISECAALMNKPALSTAEVKKIVALHSQYALNEEYILTLAAHLADKGKLTATRLTNEAIGLTERGIDTAEALLDYIEMKKRQNDIDLRIRRVVGQYDRNISPSEHELFRKWIEEFGYSENIITEAFDITVANINKFKASYADKILTRWHDSGCKTLAECRMRVASDKEILAAERKAKAQAEKEKKKKSEQTSKYGAFNAEDALMSALLRSYGEEDKGEA